jgi:hypothetical protein
MAIGQLVFERHGDGVIDNQKSIPVGFINKKMMSRKRVVGTEIEPNPPNFSCLQTTLSTPTRNRQLMPSC